MFAFTQTSVCENQLILILAGLLLLYSTGMGIIVTSGSRATYYLNNPPVETANNKVRLQYTFFHWDLHHGQCIVYLV
jgi:choline-glycine betaine transporter